MMTGKTGGVVAVLAGVLCLLAYTSPAAQAADKKLESSDVRFFLRNVPYARLVATVTVADASVIPNPRVRRSVRGKHAWLEDIAFGWGPVLYGTVRKTDLASLQLAATPPRAAAAPPPRFRKGDKLLLLRIGYPKWTFTTAVPWGKEVERAAAEALAPGWHVRGRFICPWCRGRKFPANVGTCAACGARTSSGMKTLCPRCARVRGRCPACARTVGPPTLGVELRLKTLSPKLHQVDPLAIAVAPGAAPELWVWVESKPGAVPEFLCRDSDLRTCDTLFFLVQRPGASRPDIAFFERRAGAARGEPTPLAGSQFRPLTLRPRSLFERHGVCTVRAVAGRLVSNPVTVTVKPLGAVAEPRPGPAPAGAQWKPDSPVVARRSPDGRVLWKMKLRFKVGQIREQGGLWIITSGDGRTEATVHAATGKIVRLEKRAP